MGLGPDLRLVVFDLDGTLLHLDVDWDRVRRLLGLAAKYSASTGVDNCKKYAEW